MQNVTLSTDRSNVTLTPEQFRQAANRLNRFTTGDLLTDIVTQAEELALDIKDRFGPEAYEHVGDTFEYHVAITAVNGALKTIMAAIGEIRNAWVEDSGERVKRYRKREAQRRAGQMELPE